MTNSLSKTAALICVACVMAATTVSRADITLPALFSDNMVLQRGIATPIWGSASLGEKVTVTFDGQTASTIAGSNGNWTAKLSPLAAGGPYTLTVAGDNKLTVNNVLVGEVWLASGQSNMQYTLGAHRDIYAADDFAANDPQLRCFTVADNASFSSLTDVKGQWQAATPDNAWGFSAVGYFYARELRKVLGVPVGIINSSYGGTQLESWMSMDALGKDPAIKQFADQQLAAMHSRADDDKAFAANMPTWLAGHGAVDSGNVGFPQGWAKADFDDTAWMKEPNGTRLSTMGYKGGGVVWYRKSIQFPANVVPSDFLIGIGQSSAVYTMYLNGVPLAEKYPTLVPFNPHSTVFLAPASLVRPGQPNVFAIRQVAPVPSTYLWMPVTEMRLPFDATTLDNNWQVKVEQTFPPITQADLQSMPVAPDAVMQNTATTLYNAMIAPLIPYGIRGAIWYQGESNQQRGETYGKTLPLMISDWRTKWSEGAFPFYIVQLANFGGAPNQPQVHSGWALVREGQLHTAQTLPNSGVAVTVDLGGDGSNLHPTRKAEVGQRLSKIALANVYGQTLPYSGPIYTGMSIEGATIRLKFDHIEGGLVAQGGEPLKQFAIAGADHNFVWADAKIDGDTVVVSAPAIPQPSAVRYAWADNPLGCNLYNAAGLPASPFRTDSW